MSKLYAVATQDKDKSPQQEAHEAVQQYREKQHALTVGERIGHRGWPPDVVRAFLCAPVIKPAKGEIQRKLYGMVNRV